MLHLPREQTQIHFDAAAKDMKRRPDFRASSCNLDHVPCSTPLHSAPTRFHSIKTSADTIIMSRRSPIKGPNFGDWLLKHGRADKGLGNADTRAHMYSLARINGFTPF